MGGARGDALTVIILGGSVSMKAYNIGILSCLTSSNAIRPAGLPPMVISKKTLLRSENTWST